MWLHVRKDCELPDCTLLKGTYKVVEYPNGYVVDDMLVFTKQQARRYTYYLNFIETGGDSGGGGDVGVLDDD